MNTTHQPDGGIHWATQPNVRSLERNFLYAQFAEIKSSYKHRLLWHTPIDAGHRVEIGKITSHWKINGISFGIELVSLMILKCNVNAEQIQLEVC